MVLPIRTPSRAIMLNSVTSRERGNCNPETFICRASPCCCWAAPFTPRWKGTASKRSDHASHEAQRRAHGNSCRGISRRQRRRQGFIPQELGQSHGISARVRRGCRVASERDTVRLRSVQEPRKGLGEHLTFSAALAHHTSVGRPLPRRPAKLHCIDSRFPQRRPFHSFTVSRGEASAEALPASTARFKPRRSSPRPAPTSAAPARLD